MGIRPRAAPPESLAALDESLGPPSRGMGERDLPGRAQSYPVHSVALWDLASAAKLASAARYLGWRHVIADESGLRAGEGAERHGRHRLTPWNHGRFNGELVLATERAAAAPDLAGADYEPRVLLVPALCVHALWLVDKDAARSLVVPLPPTDPALEAYALYPADAFVAALAVS